MRFPFQLIDLTHTLYSDIPTWSGGCGFSHDLHIDYIDCQVEDKFRVMKVKMHSGIGTHMDAPSHCIQGGKCIDQFTLNDLCMPCFVIDISHKAHERYSLSCEDILEFESSFGKITQDSCVMVKTGWERFWKTPNQYRNNHIFPSISQEASCFLLERGVKALGIDTLSPDRPEDGFKVHQSFLGKGNLLIENVAHLNEMPAYGAYIMALPLKIKDGTEAPIRLVGLTLK